MATRPEVIFCKYFVGSYLAWSIQVDQTTLFDRKLKKTRIVLAKDMLEKFCVALVQWELFPTKSINWQDLIHEYGCYWGSSQLWNSPWKSQFEACLDTREDYRVRLPAHCPTYTFVTNNYYYEEVLAKTGTLAMCKTDNRGKVKNRKRLKDTWRDIF